MKPHLKKSVELLTKYLKETPEQELIDHFNSIPDFGGITIGEFIENIEKYNTSK